MLDSAPSPSSSSSGDENTIDSPPSPPPPEDSEASPPYSNSGGSSSPSPPNSEGSGTPPPPQPPTTSSESSPSSGTSDSLPPPTPSPPAPKGEGSNSPPSDGNSNSSPPFTPSLPPPTGGNSDSSTSSTPSLTPPNSQGSEPPPAPHPPHAPRTPPGGSSSRVTTTPASPPSLPHGQSDSQPEGSISSPPAANQSVIVIPVPVLSPPGAAIAPPTATGSVPSAHLPGSLPAQDPNTTTIGIMASPSGLPDTVPTSSSGGRTSSVLNNNNGSSSQHSSLSSSRIGSITEIVAFVGIAAMMILAAVFAIFLVMAKKKKKKKKKQMDGLVYHYGSPPSFSRKAGSHYMQSNQFVVSNPSGTFYPPRGAKMTSYGPAGTENFGGGYYHSGTVEPPGSKSSFSYEELVHITGNFSRDNVIGEGGFGFVYKGWLSDGKCVAVKQLKAGSGQGEREFQVEVEIISRVHHRHLVSLVGYCIAQHHRMLVYEFVPNGTLDHHLHSKGLRVMDWSKRQKIAIGAAKGLAYLHEDCHPRIIHRDIKSANILLDYSFEAQVADFGLAKLSNDSHTHVSTRIMGTFGYLAPEYASSGKLTDRSDVFSFGVVLLELITGRKPVDQTRPTGEESLVEWARPVLVRTLEMGDFDGLVDPQLGSNYKKGEMLRMVEVAAVCVRHSAPKRPRMVQVVRALDDEGGVMDLTNGVKVGQSQGFDSSQQQADIQWFRRMAFAVDECSEEFNLSREHGAKSMAYSGGQHGTMQYPTDNSSGEHGNDSDTRPMNRRPSNKGSTYQY